MRYLILLLAFNLFAADYDNLLLRAQASIFPRIILLDTSIPKENLDNPLTLNIIYNKDELSQAKHLKELIDTQYNNKLGKFNFIVNLIDTAEFNQDSHVHAYYIFNANGDKKQKIIKHIAHNKSICFGYDYKSFEQDILISLHVKEKTYIYLNKNVLDKYNIKFMPIFYNIVKVVE